MSYKFNEIIKDNFVEWVKNNKGNYLIIINDKGNIRYYSIDNKFFVKGLECYYDATSFLELFKTSTFYEIIEKDLDSKLESNETKNLILYSLLYQTLEKQNCENVSSQIEQMTGLLLKNQSDWFKSNRNYDNLKQKYDELLEELETIKYKTVIKVAYAKAIREFARLIDDINWFDKNEREVNVKTLINKQYEELTKHYQELFLNSKENIDDNLS